MVYLEIPVIYELDEDGEATGTVHFYCSIACRFQSVDVDSGENGTSSDWCDGSICETCGRPLDTVTV